MKKKIVSCMLTGAMLASSVAVWANEITNSGYENGVYTVTGRADEAGQPIRIEVLENGYVFGDLQKADLSAVKDYYLYVGQTEADKDGNFSFSVKKEAGTTNHVVRLSFFGGDVTLADSFATYSETEMNDAIDAFLKDNNQTAEKLIELVDRYYGRMGIDYDSFKNLSKTVITGHVIDGLTAQSGSADLIRALSQNISAQQISEAKDAKTAAALLELYISKSDKIDAAYQNAWKGLEAAKKESLAAKLIGRSLSADELIAETKNIILIDELNTALWNEQEGILKKYVKDTKIDQSKLSGVTGTAARKEIFTQFKSRVANGSITKASEMLGAINTLCDLYGGSTGGSVTKPGGLGGSGGTGGIGQRGESVQNPVTEEIKQPLTLPFDDLADVDWAYNAILYLYQNNIINGKSETAFAPNDAITREEYAAMLIRAFDMLSADAACAFKDVPIDRWSYSAVASAYKAGVVQGIDEGYFGAQEHIVRQDMAVMAYRTATLNGAQWKTEADMKFSDKNQIAAYATEAVAALNEAEIIRGTGNGFASFAEATRAEAAKVIYGLLLYCGRIG